MTSYRRNFMAGGSFFFTVNLAQRRRRLLTDHIDELRTAFRETRRHHPFTIDAMVVLPDHLHSVWTMPENDADFATRWRLIKTAFSRCVPLGERISDSRAAKGERGIWQRRYWEHTIHDENDFAHHIDYVHINPVKHGFVTRVQDWPHSSFHRMAKLGIYPEDWAGDVSDHGEAFSERQYEREANGYLCAPPILRVNKMAKSVLQQSLKIFAVISAIVILFDLNVQLTRAMATSSKSERAIWSAVVVVDEDARGAFLGELTKFAEKEAFAIRTSQPRQDARHFLVQMWRDDINIIILNSFDDPTPFSVFFYQTGTQSVSDEEVRSLVQHLTEELSLIRGVNFKQKN